MQNDARQIANWFVHRFVMDNRRLSVMELLKHTYIAHGWHLEMYGSPLFHNRVEAWQYGPVIPDVYYAFQPQGLDVRHQVAGFFPPADERTAGFLEQVYNTYGHYSAWQLSNLTHVPGGPWHATMEIAGPFHRIPDSVIKPHYEAQRRQVQAHG